MRANTIITGDSAEVLATFPPDCIDLTVTSPPYDNLRTYNGFTFDFERSARELYRVTKPGGVVVWVVGDATINGSETLTSFKQALYFRECGFDVETMIYDKLNPMPGQMPRYQQEFEYMFVFSKGSVKTFNPIKIKSTQIGKRQNGNYRNENGKMKQRFHENHVTQNEKKLGNVWGYYCGGSHNTTDAGVYDHPATFPEALAADHILSWSNPGDLVLDCFAGSGTTLKKAKELGRDYIGIEISPEYVEIINKRLLATNPPLFT
jgi:DNA modification methylase